VGNYLQIYNNPVLDNVDGLASLASVGQDLNLWGNNAITNIDGLANLVSVGGDIYIHDNPALCQSSIDAIITACPACGSTGNISGNDNGC